MERWYRQTVEFVWLLQYISPHMHPENSEILESPNTVGSEDQLWYTDLSDTPPQRTAA